MDPPERACAPTRSSKSHPRAPPPDPRLKPGPAFVTSGGVISPFWEEPEPIPGIPNLSSSIHAAGQRCAPQAKHGTCRLSRARWGDHATLRHLVSRGGRGVPNLTNPVTRIVKRGAECGAEPAGAVTGAVGDGMSDTWCVYWWHGAFVCWQVHLLQAAVG